MFLFIRQGAKNPELVCWLARADQTGEGGGPWIMFYWLWFPGSASTSLLSNSTQPSVGVFSGISNHNHFRPLFSFPKQNKH